MDEFPHTFTLEDGVPGVAPPGMIGVDGDPEIKKNHYIRIL